jgi:dUTP pyrophosphatase
MTLHIKLLRESAIMPKYWSESACGIDLHSDIDLSANVINGELTIWQNEARLIPTGLSMEIPEGFGGFIFPKSGLGHKGLILGNGTGVIDSDYRGEIFISAYNRTVSPIKIKQGQRIAQMVFMRIQRLELVETDELGDTNRGDGGFGSTGE